MAWETFYKIRNALKIVFLLSSLLFVFALTRAYEFVYAWLKFDILQD